MEVTNAELTRDISLILEEFSEHEREEYLKKQEKYIVEKKEWLKRLQDAPLERETSYVEVQPNRIEYLKELAIFYKNLIFDISNFMLK